MNVPTLNEFAAHYDINPSEPNTAVDYRNYCERLAALRGAMAEALPAGAGGTNRQSNFLSVQRRARRMARNLTALQQCCHSLTYAERLPELVEALSAQARRIDELEVMSAGTPFNGLIEQANRYTTSLLLALQAASPNALSPTEVGTLLTPAIRLLTKAEHQAWGAVA